MHRTLDRNFVLQRHLERSCKRLEKEFKIAQRKSQNVAEACVAFTYKLLQEATVREKEKIKSRPNPSVSSEGITKCNCNKETKRIASHVRPLTAHTSRVNRKNSQKRPSSAHPIIPTNSRDISPECEQLHTQLKAAKETTAIKSDTTHLKTNIKGKSIESNMELRSQISEISSFSRANNENIDKPKTADFYKRKQPECELAIFWTRKVNAVIAKWDKEDYELDFRINKTDDVQHIRKLVTPPLQKVALTESEKRLKAFVRRFGQKYRTQISPVSPTTTISNGGRKNFNISGRELASIHADTARRLKNTQIVVKKSGKLQHNVERYLDFSST